MPGPYASRAREYWTKSWQNPIPVRGKSHPVSGFTGFEGANVSWPDLERWIKSQGDLNIGLRALAWVGIDVDDYDDKNGARALKLAQAELGELPVTWTSTARGPDQPARIHFYRVPFDADLARSEKRFNDRFGQDVDIIHRTHRYAIVAPSVHPATGKEYRWYAPDGQASEEIPPRAELSELPPGWLDFLINKAVTEPAPDDFFDTAGKDAWTRAHAERAIAEKLDLIKAMDRHSKVNEVLGGAARFVGRFVPALLTEEQAAARLVAALDANDWHSDAWNVANGKNWTGRTVIGAALANGQAEAFQVEPEPEIGQPEMVGGTLAAPSDPMAVARELATRMTRPRAWWRGDFYAWEGTRYDITEISVVERWLYRQTENARYLVPDAKGEMQPKKWAPTKKKITDLVHALGVGVIQRVGEDERCIATANGVLRLAGRELLAHDSSRFNLHSLPFAYRPEAQCPAWHAFLDEVLPGDRQAQDFLAEWFGYVLSGRTDQQKMAALIGKRRSGKGTVARVLGAMLGPEGVAGLDLNLVSTTFGLENLIGKTLAVSGDVRWHSRNVGDAVPVLLGVIGEDAISINRKNRTAWTGRLGVRFMLMSNDTPTFSDRSGALGGRMIYVKFDQSFYGREDTSLTDKLLGELPGILNWAMDGLERLNGRGRFTEPESGMAEANAVRRLSDPMGAFLEDWCTVGPDESISLDHLYLKYQDWCVSEGRTRDSTTKEIFSRDLRSKVPGLTSKRITDAGRKVQILHGVGSSAL